MPRKIPRKRSRQNVQQLKATNVAYTYLRSDYSCKIKTIFYSVEEYKLALITYYIIVLWKTAKRRATCESLLYIYTRVRRTINWRNRATNFPDSVTTSLADLLPANSYIKYNYTPRQFQCFNMYCLLHYLWISKIKMSSFYFRHSSFFFYSLLINRCS